MPMLPVAPLWLPTSQPALAPSLIAVEVPPLETQLKITAKEAASLWNSGIRFFLTKYKVEFKIGTRTDFDTITVTTKTREPQSDWFV